MHLPTFYSVTRLGISGNLNQRSNLQTGGNEEFTKSQIDLPEATSIRYVTGIYRSAPSSVLFC